MLEPRAPVVTIMGHVDHGKTSLLDALRQTDVAGGEAGGITQHIGAYRVTLADGKQITFIDTPGHQAFTAMRARGANVTDIVVLVVAADDGIMEQTVEAIRHAKAAEVPIIVAINKIDRPDARPERVRQELLQHELVVEELGGEVLDVEVSALKKTNLDKLQEAILLQAELLDLQGEPEPPGRGRRARSQARPRPRPGRDGAGAARHAGYRRHLRRRRRMGPGPRAGRRARPAPGRGRSVDADRGARVQRPAARRRRFRRRREREPGARDRRFPPAPQARRSGARPAGAARSSRCSRRSRPAPPRSWPVVVKGDVQGSVEAIVGSLERISTDEVAVRVLHSGVGGITESDVILAKATGALIIGFNVRANPQARELAQRDGVEIRYYAIIYDLIDDVRSALSGMLSPTLRERFLGNASIREVFNITRVGKVAGCMVTEGVVRRGAKVRLLRDNVVIHEGALKTLKRFKDEVREVREGYECGMAFENYENIQVGDVIECFEIEEVARAL